MNMDERPLPNLGILDKLNAMRQRVSRNSKADQCLVRLIKLVECFTTWLERVKKAPFTYKISFALSLTVGILGVVPGALSLVGCDKASAIVTIIAGAGATILAGIQFYPQEDWIKASNA